jgi:glycine cleavage system aminomethyltransferase T
MIAQLINLFGGFAEIKEVYGNKVVAVANDVQADYLNIRNDAAIFPMNITTYYKITGDEAEEILDYLLTKSVQYLNYGQNRLCYFLRETGEVAAFVTLYKNDESFIVEAFNWNAQEVETIFHKNNITFEKLNYSCILIEGVNAIGFMADAMELTVDYFVYQSHQNLECFGKEVMVARTGYTGEFGYKIIGDTDSVLSVWENILPEHKNKVSGYNAFEMCHYEIKQPFWELPYLLLSKNAFEVDYHWLVDFKKDTEYVGKEALLNEKFAEASHRIIGAVCENESPLGDDVVLEGEVIGKVVDSRLSYGLGKYITMIFVDKEYAHANVDMETAAGQKLLTVSAPYIFPASWTADR